MEHNSIYVIVVKNKKQGTFRLLPAFCAFWGFFCFKLVFCKFFCVFCYAFLNGSNDGAPSCGVSDGVPSCGSNVGDDGNGRAPNYPSSRRWLYRVRAYRYPAAHSAGPRLARRTVRSCYP